MLLHLSAEFDLQRDVSPWLLAQAPAAALGNADTFEKSSAALYIVNIERNGKIIYTWKHLYTFERDVHIISSSVNSERTLLAVSFLQSTKEERVNQLLQPVSKCLALLIEIHPVNNVKVLKAVDSWIKVQFLHTVAEKQGFPKSHLLLISEDKYVEQIHIHVVMEEEHKVVFQKFAQFPREKVADDLIWAQWDMIEQRLFYIVPKDSGHILKCVQFGLDGDSVLILEAPLDMPLTDIGLKLVNFGYDYWEDQERVIKPPNLQVYTNETGSLCVCYSQTSDKPEGVTYSVTFLHKGYSKTYTVSLEGTDFPQGKDMIFLNLDYYVAVYLPGNFLHLLSTLHPEPMCYNLFLTGENARINELHSSSIQSTLKATVLDCCSGKMLRVRIDECALLRYLWNSKLDSDRLAALHCALLLVGSKTDLEKQIIQWISEKVSMCDTFDPIQEFIIASLYWRMCLDADKLDKLLPYTSLLHWNGIIPGVTCVTDIISLPILKVQNCSGFWEKLNSNLECVKYVGPHLHYNNRVLRREWYHLLSEERTVERRATTYLRNLFENAKKVLSNLDTWNIEERRVPIFQEEDYQQRLLMGLMVSQLRDHLMRHLQYVGKKKVDQLVLDYVSKLVDLICRMMEAIWRKYNLDSCIFCFKGRGSAAEYAVFHILSRILEAASGLCIPLPPGFHTVHVGLGVRCLPLHTLLHYIDVGVLHLTETCVLRLLKDLDNTEENEKLKFSIVARLPEAVGHKICQLWNHPVSSNFIARKYVKLLLERVKNRQHSRPLVDRPSAHIEFLPLNYLASMLAEVEHQGQNPSEEREDVNVRFLEETALKHTTMLLGL
uniref:Gamma-secretase activating protein n=1 Tax=Sphenodon punctatus TaxID=8508 RepID=A0A8D0H6E8_SPHPU